MKYYWKLYYKIFKVKKGPDGMGKAELMKCYCRTNGTEYQGLAISSVHPADFLGLPERKDT